jgi:hypothetical protein
LYVDGTARRSDRLRASRFLLGEAVVDRDLGKLAPEQLGPARCWLGQQLQRQGKRLTAIQGCAMAEVLHQQTLVDAADLTLAQRRIRAEDQRAELRLGQTVSVFEFPYDGHTGQLTVWHDTGLAAIDLGEGSLWGFWDEDSETVWVDDGEYVRQQFNTAGELVAEFRR